jgi:putative addiction module component (TIGR02574 family)
VTTKAGEPNEQAARALVAQALRLSESERVRVAAELLESVEGPADDTSDDDWIAEINRRAESVRRGESVGEPWPLVRDELLAELKK